MQTTDDRKPALACFSQQPFTGAAMAAFAQRHLMRPLTSVTDGLGCFKVTAHAGVHQRIVTGGGKAAAAKPQFAAVNTVLSNLKTALSGTYHAFDFRKYAHRYLAQVQYLFNRRFDLKVILKRLLRAACVTSPHTRVVIRAAEVGA